ncbi:MAG: sarcosine oxidase subunit gamma SoxG [Deltaproteobacteria bacterium]|nr:sarcosine oxidase subunit gamma SoxG [Deltaproteobacteria bacterium]
MSNMMRKSPVVFHARPEKIENRDHWNVVLAYDGEGDGPYLVDLCHRQRWDLQDGNLSALTPWGVQVPETFCQCALENGLLINRMNRTQAALWQIQEEAPAAAELPGLTETMDATVFLALFGKQVFAIAEKLTSLDLAGPDVDAPFLFQGPFSHVPCQIVVLETAGDHAGILLTCSRGYAKDMVHAIMDAGAEFGLKPAGEDRFNGWIEKIIKRD